MGIYEKNHFKQERKSLMKLLAISLARLIAFTDIYEWSPRNAVPLHEFTQAFVERYGFLKFPQRFEEFELEKGIVFQAGRSGEVNIISVTFFKNGIVVDTRSSTEDAENFLNDASAWAEQFFGIEHAPNRITRKMFLSQLSFHSEIPFDFINPKLRNLALRLN